ncbi:MAG: hypothetical protein LBO02_00050 [Holosporaceae bacterium]|nr:hypothetical protein [Holosporaceae bacterium]
MKEEAKKLIYWSEETRTHRIDFTKLKEIKSSEDLADVVLEICNSDLFHEIERGDVLELENFIQEKFWKAERMLEDCLDQTKYSIQCRVDNEAAEFEEYYRSQKGDPWRKDMTDIPRREEEEEEEEEEGVVKWRDLYHPTLI